MDNEMVRPFNPIQGKQAHHEIRDRVREEIAEKICNGCPIHDDCFNSDSEYRQCYIDEPIDAILAIPELAIVDRKAKLPPCPIKVDCIETGLLHQQYLLAQQSMLQAGYVKEVK